MTADDAQVESVLSQVAAGDTSAAGRLFEMHRNRLKRMIQIHLDRRLSARLDPSDVVQESLAEAARRLPDYLRDRPLPFYPWLRQIAWDQLLHLRQRHVVSQRRALDREKRFELDLPDESALELAGRFVASGTSPSERLLREELCQRVRLALDRLAPRDREVLVLRYLEQMSTHEATAVLGISQSAFKKRQMRAIQRLRDLLDGGDLGAMS